MKFEYFIGDKLESIDLTVAPENWDLDQFACQSESNGNLNWKKWHIYFIYKASLQWELGSGIKP